MIGIVLAILLVGHVSAHLTLVAALGKRISALRTALAFVVSPLAPYFGFKNGVTRRSWAWLGTLALYALAVSVARGCV